MKKQIQNRREFAVLKRRISDSYRREALREAMKKEPDKERIRYLNKKAEEFMIYAHRLALVADALPEVTVMA